MVDYGWAALGLGAVAIGVLLLFSVAMRMMGSSRRLGQIELVVGAIGLVYVAIFLINGGFIFLIGAISSIALIALGVLARR